LNNWHTQFIKVTSVTRALCVYLIPVLTLFVLKIRQTVKSFKQKWFVVYMFSYYLPCIFMVNIFTICRTQLSLESQKTMGWRYVSPAPWVRDPATKREILIFLNLLSFRDEPHTKVETTKLLKQPKIDG